MQRLVHRARLDADVAEDEQAVVAENEPVSALLEDVARLRYRVLDEVAYHLKHHTLF